MSNLGSVDAIRSAVAALNRGDVDGYLQHFDPSCPRWVAGLEPSLDLTAVAEGFRQLRAGFDPLHLDEDALFGSGDLVCARWRLHGVHVGDYLGIPATGRAVSVQQCEVYEFTGDRVTTVWTYGDPAELFRQIKSDSPVGGVR